MITDSCQRDMVNAYFHHRWHKLMGPLCSAFQQWKAGLADRGEAEQALDRAYQDSCALRSLSGLRLDHLIAIIQVSDRDWFLRWTEEHCPPPGAEIPAS